jgi:hypothetical protein
MWEGGCSQNVPGVDGNGARLCRLLEALPCPCRGRGLHHDFSQFYGTRFQENFNGIGADRHEERVGRELEPLEHQAELAFGLAGQGEEPIRVRDRPAGEPDDLHRNTLDRRVGGGGANGTHEVAGLAREGLANHGDDRDGGSEIHHGFEAFLHFSA